MNKGGLAMGSAGLGAGLMYLLDPQRGRRRRALLRNQLIHLANKTGDGVEATSEDLANRARGLAAGLRARLQPAEVDDVVLAERVRAQLGFLVRHPGAIEVAAENGRVILSGQILAEDVDSLLAGVARVRGVRAVEQRLEVHQKAGDLPDLQGAPAAPRGQQPEFRQVHWSPTARLVAGMAGVGLAAYGLRRRDLFGASLAPVGMALLGRGLTDMELKRLVGVGAGRRAVDIQKTINIDAPVEEVFHFWSRIENFPRFMEHVQAVRDNGRGVSHWTVAGPVGVPISWDAIVTKQVENEVLAWKTVDGSAVAHAGIVRFQPNASGGTRLDVRLSYNPPGGALGHLVASLFGVDPKHAMDDDFVRLKSLLERERTSAKGEEVTREELDQTSVRGSSGG